MAFAFTKPLSFYTRKSFGFHLGIVALACGVSWFNFQSGEKQRKINIKLVQSSVRVDMVALPQKTLKELEAIQSSSPVVKGEPVEEKQPPKVDPTPDKGNEFLKNTKKKSLADLLKGYSKNKPKIKVKKRGVRKAKTDSLSKKDRALLDSLVKRGNKIQKGEALTGQGSAEVLTAVQTYASKLASLTKPFWKIPSYLADRGLRARIRVYINGQGRVVRSVIYESSGEEEFDNRALAAVKRASPFPAPDKKISKNIVNGDILLGFPL